MARVPLAWPILLLALWPATGLWAQPVRAGGIAATHEKMTSEMAAAWAAGHAPDVTAAFVAAFGGPPPHIVAQAVGAVSHDVHYTPAGLFRLSADTWVLVSNGAIPDAAHYIDGHLAIHYLRKAGKGFVVTARLLDAGGGFGFGYVADWQTRYDIDGVPDLWTGGGYTGQGCATEAHDLIRLAPEGPALVGRNIVTRLDDEGQSDDPALHRRIDGRIVPITVGLRFDVVYTGNLSATQHYVYGTGGYATTDQAMAARVVC